MIKQAIFIKVCLINELSWNFISEVFFGGSRASVHIPAISAKGLRRMRCITNVRNVNTFGKPACHCFIRSLALHIDGTESLVACVATCHHPVVSIVCNDLLVV